MKFTMKFTTRLVFHPSSDPDGHGSTKLRLLGIRAQAKSHWRALQKIEAKWGHGAWQLQRGISSVHTDILDKNNIYILILYNIMLKFYMHSHTYIYIHIILNKLQILWWYMICIYLKQSWPAVNVSTQDSESRREVYEEATWFEMGLGFVFV